MKAHLLVVPLLVASLLGITAQPFKPGQKTVLPLGNLRTNDGCGPYDLSLLPVQVNEVLAGIAARKDYTDQDIVNFLTNVECLEGLFDTWGTFGRGFNGDLDKGAPTPIGARAAKLTNKTRPFLEEVALNEQGHALFTRHAGSSLPCPLIDFDEGFNSIMVLAFKLQRKGDEKATETVARKFGKPFDPFKNDQNFVLSVLTLEEVGARGNKGLIGLCSNPVIANAVAGLATSACSQATSERRLLWDLRDEEIEPFGEKAHQVFARVSAARDELDGPPVDDQGLTNTDPRLLAVPTKLVNMVPTDWHGLTFSMTPQQVLRIVTAGAPGAKGGFFPKGVNGRINSWEGYDELDPHRGVGDWPECVATAAPKDEVGDIPSSPILPKNVTDEKALTQALGGPLDNGTKDTRGYKKVPSQEPFFSKTVKVDVAQNGKEGDCPAKTVPIRSGRGANTVKPKPSSGDDDDDDDHHDDKDHSHWKVYKYWKGYKHRHDDDHHDDDGDKQY